MRNVQSHKALANSNILIATWSVVIRILALQGGGETKKYVGNRKMLAPMPQSCHFFSGS